MDPSIIGGARVKVQIDESMMLYRKSHTVIIPNRNFVMVILVAGCLVQPHRGHVVLVKNSY